MANILVTDGEQRSSLAVVRSLGSAGHRLFVCSTRSRSLAGASRFCMAQSAVPDALRCAEEFVDAVARLVTFHGIDVLIPISEPSLLAILPAKDRFPGIRIPFAPVERFREICDKAAVTAAASAVGIRVPGQVLATSLEDALEAMDRVRYPIVIKPSRSVAGDGAERIKTGVIHVDGREALKEALAALTNSAYPLLLQERITGPGIGVFVLLTKGRLRAAFAHRRIREKPPSGGVSVYRESAALDADLVHRSVELLRRFEWEGVAMVEYKVCDKTSTPYIMEINGRFWGSLQLAIDAGIDFPRLLVDEDSRADPACDYSVGVRSRWEWGDVDHLIARLRYSNDELDLPPGSPGRLRSIRDFLAAFGSGRNEILRAADPMPFIRESMDWFRGR